MIAIHINSNEEWEATKELLNPIGIKHSPYGECFIPIGFNNSFVASHSSFELI